MQKVELAQHVGMMLLVIVLLLSCAGPPQQPETAVSTFSAETLLDEMIGSYRKRYPELAFLVLQGGDELLYDMMSLHLVLGHQPLSLDYEHPPELREDLMFVSIERIWIMLRDNMPSASLFKADAPLGWQQHVCVLTINPRHVANDANQATRHLLSQDMDGLQDIPRSKQLSPQDYLAFVIDHEVYHCLKSMYVGPQAMSKKSLWGEYSHFCEEKGADAYALAMHIKNHQQYLQFADNILRVRGMSLFNIDPDHLTCDAIQQVLAMPADDIRAMNDEEIFALATRIKNALSPDYDEYVLYLASAVRAMQLLGVRPEQLEALQLKLGDQHYDVEQVNSLIDNARCCYNELCSEPGPSY